MKKKNSSDFKNYSLFIFGAFIAGFVPILVRFGDNIGAYNLSFFRVFLTAIFLGGFFLISRKKLMPPKYEKGKLFIFSFLHGFIILGYFLAINYLSIASAVLLMFMFPIWMALFAYPLLGEKISKRVGFALVLAFVGLIFVLSPKDFFLFESLIGTICGLLAGLGAGLVYVMSKTFKKYDKFSLTFWQNSIAIIFVLPLLFIDFPKFQIVDIWIVGLIGLFTVIPFVAYYVGLGRVKASSGGVLLFLEGIIPVILAIFVFSEVPSSKVILGGLLIFIGAYLAVTDK